MSKFPIGAPDRLTRPVWVLTDTSVRPNRRSSAAKREEMPSSGDIERLSSLPNGYAL